MFFIFFRRFKSKRVQHVNVDAKVNVNLMKEIVIQIIGGIMINVNVRVKNVMHVKKIICGILLHVIMKMENISIISWMIQRLCVMKL